MIGLDGDGDGDGDASRCPACLSLDEHAHRVPRRHVERLSGPRTGASGGGRAFGQVLARISWLRGT